MRDYRAAFLAAEIPWKEAAEREVITIEEIKLAANYAERIAQAANHEQLMAIAEDLKKETEPLKEKTRKVWKAKFNLLKTTGPDQNRFENMYGRYK